MAKGIIRQAAVDSGPWKGALYMNMNKYDFFMFLVLLLALVLAIRI